MTKNNVTDSTASEKGAYFLRWVAENQKEMRKALKKNCTFDAEIFDDVFNEVIINVYNTIKNNNRTPDNLKYYFFMALKFHYRMRQNQRRKHIANAVYDFFETHEEIDETQDATAREEDTKEAIAMMRSALVEAFGEKWTEIFLTYWAGRIKNETSYKLIASAFHLEAKQSEIKNQLQRMRSFVQEECKYIRETFTTDYAYN